MRRSGIIILLMGAALWISIQMNPQAVDALEDNIESLLQKILSNQEQMQAEIQMLKEQMAEKDREIAALREQIEQQQAASQEQIREEIIEQTRVLDQKTAQSAEASDTFAAKIQYEKARALMHETIFEVRKGEQQPWFEKTIEEFLIVVEKHPHTTYAADAQLRIARIYRRYLSEIDKARQAYQTLIDRYPDSRHVDESRKALEELKDVQ